MTAAFILDLIRAIAWPCAVVMACRSLKINVYQENDDE